jgi:hypothetical protein
MSGARRARQRARQPVLGGAAPSVSACPTPAARKTRNRLRCVGIGSVSGQRVGRELLARGKTGPLARGRHVAWLDTFSFHALDF